MFKNKWAVIEKSVIEFLSNERKMPSIVHMNRALQYLLIRNKFPEVHENLIKTFYNAYKNIVGLAMKENNSLLFLLAYYMNKKSHYHILFDVLNNYLSGIFQNDKTTIEEKAYRILCKEIINSQIAEKICN